MVPGAMADIIDVKEVPHGDLKSVWYDSPAIGTQQRRMFVYTPPGYDQSSEVSCLIFVAWGRWRRRGMA
jgi:enterochelin esterase family protein